MATSTPDQGKAASQRSAAFDKAQEDQDALDELEASRARVRELEKSLGVTATGHAHGGGLRGEIQALLRERVGYVRRDLPERTAQVDEQLAARGYRVNEKTLQKDTEEAVAAAGPGVLIEDAIDAREARQTTR